ncbi:hypothetical protein EDC01DRAFT_746933 [Geopyxis carbonaria]|nr:hypothetical protein EDC01DRAFT_746933 [Geopyxis carbonaria]
MKIISLFLGLCAVATVISSPLQSKRDLLKRDILNTSKNLTAITGLKKLRPRLEINKMQAEHPDIFNMFVLGLKRWQSMPEELDESYWRIAGIHGAPVGIPWQNQGVAGTEMGYCQHNSVLFLTWHRPYLILVEQLLVRKAMEVANEFPKKQRKRWMQAAQNVRLPYWDWAAPGGETVPAAYDTKTIKVITPTGIKTIENPMYNYKFQRTDFKDFLWGGFNDFTLANETFRSWNSTNAIRDTYASRRANTYRAFSSKRFSHFNSRIFREKVNTTVISLETVHNSIHFQLAGFMRDVEVAAFDPIFWLHHSQVDRLMSLWQAIYPASVVGEYAFVEPFNNTQGNLGWGYDPIIEDINTPLWPFRDSKSKLLIAKDFSTAASSFKYGYYYPEVPPSSEAKMIRAATVALNKLYNPLGAADNNGRLPRSRLEYNVDISFDIGELKELFQVAVYISQKPPSSAYDPAIIGGTAQFSLADGRGENTMYGSVALTPALQSNGVELDKETVIKFLKDRLGWLILGQDGKFIEFDKLKSLRVGVYASMVQYPSEDDKLPVYGEPEMIPEVTEGKIGGLKK